MWVRVRVLIRVRVLYRVRVVGCQTGHYCETWKSKVKSFEIIAKSIANNIRI